MEEGDGFFLPPAPRLATVPGRFGPARCSAAPHGPGKGGSPERGSTEAAGGKRERDLTAATAHFTACHALMAEEIKAGMELFIEINQSPRRRAENNIASSVIPGLRAPGRLSQKAPRELDALGFVTGTARPCQRLAEPGLSCPRHPWGCPEVGAGCWEGTGVRCSPAAARAARGGGHLGQMETPQLGRPAPTTHPAVRIEREKNEVFHVS